MGLILIMTSGLALTIMELRKKYKFNVKNAQCRA